MLNHYNSDKKVNFMNFVNWFDLIHKKETIDHFTLVIFERIWKTSR
jgi:hypothetical protein